MKRALTRIHPMGNSPKTMPYPAEAKTSFTGMW